MQNIIFIALFASTTGNLVFPKTDVHPKHTSQWPSLRTTFSTTPLSKGFDKMPLTAQYALSQGWRPTDIGCLNNGQFAGNRFIYEDDTSTSLLYDVNGIISGIQMNLNLQELEKTPNPYRFDDVSIFQRNLIQNDEVLTITVYFVDPAKICHKGRTPHQLYEEGIGNELTLQSGPTPAHLISIPLTRDLAIQSNWSKNDCYPMMGRHNFNDVEHEDALQCQGGRPLFLLFNNQDQLHGFAFLIFGTVEAPRYELPPMWIVEKLIGKDKVPQCVRDYHGMVGQTSMHVYFVEEPKLITCL